MIFLLQTCYKRAANPVIFTRFSPVPPRFQGEKKNPGNVMFPGFACNFNNCSVISCVIPINACLTFGELRSATSSLEAVLAYSLVPVFLDFMGFLGPALKCCPSI